MPLPQVSEDQGQRRSGRRLAKNAAAKPGQAELDRRSAQAKEDEEEYELSEDDEDDRKVAAAKPGQAVQPLPIKIISFEQRLGKLLEYADDNDGDVNVRNSYSDGHGAGRNLGAWAKKMRAKKRKGKMNKEEIAKLKGESIIASYAHLSPPLKADFRPPLAIGFLWDLQLQPVGKRSTGRQPNYPFDARFAELVEYKADHGHPNVSKGYSGNGAAKNLGRWVARCRSGKDRLTPEQKAKLDGESYQIASTRLANCSVTSIHPQRLALTGNLITRLTQDLLKW